MKKKQFRFWLYNNEELKAFLDSKDNFSEFAIEIFTLVMKNQLSPETIEELERRKLTADVRFRESRADLTTEQAKHAKWRNSFIENFGTEPTPEAMKILKVEQKNESTKQAVAAKTNEQLLDANYQRFFTLKNFSNEDWFAQCDICKWNDKFNKVVYTVEQVHQEFKRHIAAMHMSEILS